jgi:hypothetical protein
MELDATGLSWEGWEGGRLPPAAVAVLRAEATQASRPTNPSALADGTPAAINPRQSPRDQDALRLQNESAELLAQAGYAVFQHGNAPGPDYTVEGRPFDGLAPGVNDADKIWWQMKEKVDEGQTKRLVLNLGRTDVDVGALRNALVNAPIRGLKEVLIVTREGGIAQLWP